MKKLLFVLFAFISANSFAQKWETIKGNGQVKKETREVSNFTSLSSQGSMNVQISYGNSNSIVVEADENLLPYIETTVENGKLLIKAKEKCKPEIQIKNERICFDDQNKFFETKWKRKY